MKHEVPHSLGQAKAREVADKAFASYQKRFAEYEPQVNWKNERAADISFSVKGMKLTGEIEVSDRAIGLDLEVPFLLRPFKGKALEIIEAEIRKWMDLAK